MIEHVPLILFKNTNMRDNSNTFMYWVGGIILLHFVVGFIWLIYKFNKKE